MEKIFNSCAVCVNAGKAEDGPGESAEEPEESAEESAVPEPGFSGQREPSTSC